MAANGKWQMVNDVAGNGWKLLEMAKNSFIQLKRANWREMAEHLKILLAMALIGQKWLEMAEKGWNWLKISGKGWEWLTMTAKG